MLTLYTARIDCRHPDALNVTRQSGDATGVLFAPPWPMIRAAKEKQRAGTFTADDWTVYRTAYASEMRFSFARNPGAWIALMRRRECCLCCYCVITPERPWCHRVALAEIIAQTAKTHGIDARYLGELPPAQTKLNLERK